MTDKERCNKLRRNPADHGTKIAVCNSCHREFTVNVPSDTELAAIALRFWMHKIGTGTMYCDDCENRIKQFGETAEANRLKSIRFEENIQKSGIPPNYLYDRRTGKLFEAPAVNFTAEWFQAHLNNNLLVSGETGSGKSTGACFAAIKLIREEKNVRYVKIRKLFAEWVEARKSEEANADEKFFSAIAKHDLLIIDEAADKAKVTESGQEMMFELLDRIADGEIKTRVWILGNFRKGAAGEIFGSGDPVYRRLEENFVCSVARDGNMAQIHVYKQRQTA